MGTRRQRVGDLAGRVVAGTQLVLVDQRVVDAVDVQVTQDGVVEPGFEPFVGHVVAEAEPFEEILVDDVGAGADDAIDHAVANHVDEHLLQAGTDQRPGQAENDAALFVA